MKRVLSILGVFFMLGSCVAYAQEIPVEEQEPIEIVETTSIEPNAVILAKEEVRYTKHWNKDLSDNTINITQADAEMLLKIAWSEAGNQGINGQKRIMEVVWNRVLSPDYPDSVWGVISQTGQFESFTNGQYNVAQPTWETHQALAEFEKNLSYDNSIVAFETSVNGRSLERYYQYSFSEGAHDFYIKKD